MVHKTLILILMLFAACVVIFSCPAKTAGPSASPADHAREDLSRFVYPSLKNIKWKSHFIMPHENLERLFADNWLPVARLNRIDRRHVYPGMTIKVPENMPDILHYCPLPRRYEPAAEYPKYILIDVGEQWLGGYEYGALRFSTPAATGIEGHLTPLGIFRIDARHKKHTSSLYKTSKGDAQYPMDYALRFHIDADHVSYWIHARDLPGRPASHGCVGIYDEEMQLRVYGVPAKPLINDAARLFHWVSDDNEEDEENNGQMTLIEDGPPVEIRGTSPQYLNYGSKFD